jgi:Tfp pilus assembly protein PilZ
LADYMEKRKQHRYKIRWPITIYTRKGPIDGESRNITGSGIFIHCQEELNQDEVYKMVIKFPEREPVELKGRLVWSNLEGVDSKGAFAGMGFSFVKFSSEDRRRIDGLTSTDVH